MKPFNNIAVSPTEPENKADVWIQHATNLFDGAILENYGYNTDTGELEASSTRYCNKNKIKVKPNETILATKNGEAFAIRYFFYGNDNNFISQELGNKVDVKIPENASFMNFHLGKTDVNNDATGIELKYTSIQDDILVNDNGVYNSVLSKQDYTLNQERKVGKWLNGEDLYEMIVKGTTPATVDGYTNSTINLSEYNIKDCFIKNAWLYQGSNPNVTIRPLPYITNTGNTVKCYYQKSDKSLYISTNESTYKSITIYIIIMYTKN